MTMPELFFWIQLSGDCRQLCFWRNNVKCAAEQIGGDNS